VVRNAPDQRCHIQVLPPIFAAAKSKNIRCAEIKASKSPNRFLVGMQSVTGREAEHRIERPPFPRHVRICAEGHRSPTPGLPRRGQGAAPERIDVKQEAVVPEKLATSKAVCPERELDRIETNVSECCGKPRA
jgi:hypothetical protein